MIRSMTGFGTALGRIGVAEVTVELRTVNHRFFNPSLKLHPALAAWEPEVREALRGAITRGHVTVTVRLARDARAVGVVNEERFAAYVRELRALQERYALPETLDLATVLRLPDVIGEGDAVAGTVEELLAVVRDALDALTRMREREGARLAELLAGRLGLVEEALECVAERAPARLEAERERLRRSIRELSDGVDVDPQRLAQEIAILADRIDVSEELDRFRAHIAAFRETLADPGAAGVGKRLGFLLQEMVREANTTGSKARDALMLKSVVAVKEELERMAEQVENLE